MVSPASETDDTEALIVELLDENNFEDEAAVGSARGASQQTVTGGYETVSVLDSFSKAKVTNWLKKNSGKPATTSSSSSSTSASSSKGKASIFSSSGSNSASPASGRTDATTASPTDAFFETKVIQVDGGDSIHQCRVKLPVPEQFGERYGEGVAANAKDAETLAAMHAERVLDALGFQLYSLGGSQRRHAEAARAAGRWAPMPEDGVRDPNTPSPQPLQMAGVQTATRVDANYHMVVPPPPGLPHRALTIFSPNYVDRQSVVRIQQYFDVHGARLKDYLRIEKQSQLGSSKSTKPSFLARIKLTGLPEVDFGVRIAMGRAHHPNAAVTLACMHAELLIDAVGVALYPGQPAKQIQHAKECQEFGRWATQPGERHPEKYSAQAPLALSLAPAGAAPQVPTSEAERLALEVESKLNAISNVKLTSFVDPKAEECALHYLLRLIPHFSIDTGISMARFGDGHFPTFRASLNVPGLPKEYGVVLAIGIADREVEAVEMCCMHLLQILGTVGIPVYLDAAEQIAFAERVRAAGGRAADPGAAPILHAKLPPPYKHFASPEKKGRFRWHVSGSERKEDYIMAEEVERVDMDDLRLVQISLPPATWSLVPDSEDGFILIHPAQVAKENRTFMHTLTSPRLLDNFAKARVLDYLERHGVSSASIVAATRSTPSSATLHTCDIRLPVPEDFGERVAHGEAYTADEAEIAAAMHAELILDSLGIPMYDSTIYQRRHSEAARRCGRFAPRSWADLKKGDTPSPPPLRKERADSVQWLRYIQRTETGRASSSSNQATEPRPASPQPGAARSAVPPVQRKMVDGPDAVGRGLHDAPVFVSKNRPPGFPSTDQTSVKPEILQAPSAEECKALRPDEIDPTVKRRLTFYIERAKRKLTDMEWVMSGDMKNHRATLEVPVPKLYGTRVAVGMGPTKQLAILACLTHAERIVNALGLQLIHVAALQRRYAEKIRKEGSWAPFPGERPRPFNTPSPPPLKVDPNALPKYPLPPDEDWGSEFTWEQVKEWDLYCEKVSKYLKSAEEQKITVSTLEMKTPRFGDPVEDDLLTIVEGLPVDHNAQIKVIAACKEAGLPVPNFSVWRWVNYGKLKDRRHYVRVPVEGTPFYASGFSVNPTESLQRATLHYYQLVNLILQAKKKKADIHIASQANEFKYETNLRDFAPEGKRHCINLFALLEGSRPPILAVKDKRGPGGITLQSALLSFYEGDEVSFTGKGEDKTKDRAAEKAVIDLFRQLTDRKSAFLSLSRFCQEHLSLSPSSASFISADPASLQTARRFIDLAAPPPLETENAGTATSVAYGPTRLQQWLFAASPTGTAGPTTAVAAKKKVPIDEVFPQLRAAVVDATTAGEGLVLSVFAATASGKSTTIPKLLLEHCCATDENVLVVCATPFAAALAKQRFTQEVNAAQLNRVLYTCLTALTTVLQGLRDSAASSKLMKKIRFIVFDDAGAQLDQSVLAKLHSLIVVEDQKEAKEATPLTPCYLPNKSLSWILLDREEEKSAVGRIGQTIASWSNPNRLIREKTVTALRIPSVAIKELDKPDAEFLVEAVRIASAHIQGRQSQTGGGTVLIFFSSEASVVAAKEKLSQSFSSSPAKSQFAVNFHELHQATDLSSVQLLLSKLEPSTTTTQGQPPSTGHVIHVVLATDRALTVPIRADVVVDTGVASVQETCTVCVPLPTNAKYVNIRQSESNRLAREGRAGPMGLVVRRKLPGSGSASAISSTPNTFPFKVLEDWQRFTYSSGSSSLGWTPSTYREKLEHRSLLTKGLQPPSRMVDALLALRQQLYAKQPSSAVTKSLIDSLTVRDLRLILIATLMGTLDSVLTFLAAVHPTPCPEREAKGATSSIPSETEETVVDPFTFVTQYRKLFPSNENEEEQKSETTAALNGFASLKVDQRCLDTVRHRKERLHAALVASAIIPSTSLHRVDVEVPLDSTGTLSSEPSAERCRTSLVFDNSTASLYSDHPAAFLLSITLASGAEDLLVKSVTSGEEKWFNRIGEVFDEQVVPLAEEDRDGEESVVVEVAAPMQLARKSTPMLLADEKKASADTAEETFLAVKWNTFFAVKVPPTCVLISAAVFNSPEANQLIRQDGGKLALVHDWIPFASTSEFLDLLTDMGSRLAAYLSWFAHVPPPLRGWFLSITQAPTSRHRDGKVYSCTIPLLDRPQTNADDGK